MGPVAGVTRNFRWSLAAAAAAVGLLAGVPSFAQRSPEPLEIRPVPTRAIPDGFTLAAVGDLIYLRPMLATLEHSAPDMLRLLRSADVTFGNFETTAVNLKSTRAVPQAESGGTWMLADPAVIPELKAMGFDIVSHANNHATDWGVEGMLETISRLDEAGLVNSGTGRNLSAARAPHYFDGPLGRVALVSASSSFTPMSRASDPLGEAPGRPGVNTLRTRKVGLVSPQDLAVLARLAKAKPGAAEVRFNGAEYRADHRAGGALEFTWELNPADARNNLLAVRQARQNSNLALFSLHAHDPGNDVQTPADATREFAHRAIDAGADAFLGHGPHQVRGIEIYKGRPIFYSLGNFAMMNNSLDVAPADMFDQYGVEPGSATTPELLQARNARQFADRNLYESVIAVSRYKGGEVVEIRLYPIDLGVDAIGADRGAPRLARPEVGRVVLERLQRLSAPFGTRITIEKGVGIWRR